MRYRLRTLHIALAVGPPILALAWLAARSMLRRFNQNGIEISVDFLLLLAALAAAGITCVVLQRCGRRA